MRNMTRALAVALILVLGLSLPAIAFAQQASSATPAPPAQPATPAKKGETAAAKK